jgi:hypothetical protein
MYVYISGSSEALQLLTLPVFLFLHFFQVVGAAGSLSAAR